MPLPGGYMGGNMGVIGPDPPPPSSVDIGAGTEIIQVEASILLSGQFWQSPVYTFNSNVYLGYLNNEDKMSIAKWVSPSTVTTAIIYDFPILNDNHGQVSIVADEGGTLYLTGGMHNSPAGFTTENNPVGRRHAWQFFTSDAVETIGADGTGGGVSADWTFRGNRLDSPNRSPPGAMITYPYFTTDRNQKIWAGYRDRFVDFNTNEPNHNIQKGSLARHIYEAGNAGTWESVGGQVGWNGSNTDTFRDAITDPLAAFYTDTYAINGNDYQPFLPHMFFDKNNRMHVVAVCQDGAAISSGGYHNNLMYIYSDNHDTANRDDIIFKNAAGSVVTLPVGPLTSPDVVAVGPDYVSDGGAENWIGWDWRVAVDQNMDPVILWTRSSKGTGAGGRFWTRSVSGGAWSTPAAITARPWIVNNDAGVMTIASGNSFFRTLTWPTPLLETVVTPDLIRSIIDLSYQEQTGLIQHRSLISGNETVWRHA